MGWLSNELHKFKLWLRDHWFRAIVVVIAVVTISYGARGLENAQREIKREAAARIQGECRTLKQALTVVDEIVVYSTKPVSPDVVPDAQTRAKLDAARLQARHEIEALIPRSNC